MRCVAHLGVTCPQSGPALSVTNAATTEPNPSAHRPAPRAPKRASVGRGAIVAVAAVAVLMPLMVLSLFIGSGNFTVDQVIEAVFGGGDSTRDLLIREYRLSRTLLAALVGAALGVAGTLMQALARNPLADPGILGVNAGAYFAVVLAAVAMGPVLGLGHVGIALVGACLATIVVWVIGSTGPAAGTATKLVLTGVALGAVLTGVAYAISLLNPAVFDRVRYWNAGSLQGRTFEDLNAVLPFLVAGIVVALFMPRALNALGLGDDVAVALGSRPALTRVVGLVAITLLCGAATAVAGPLSFIGLLAPHALRSLVGPDHRWLVPLSAVGAAALMVGADMLARVLTQAELPAGVVTAFIGAPVLVYLARRKGAKGL